MNKVLTIVIVCVASLLSSCAQKKDYLVTIKTDMGDMVAILYDETPKHKENFIKLAKDHFYDSLLIHRVIEGFMVQGGDPDSKNAEPGQRLGVGGPGYTVDAEFNPKYFHKKGALSAARLGDQQNPTRASSGSQFYIVQGTVIPTTSLEQLTTDQAKLNTGLQQLLQKEENRPLYDSLSQLYNAGDMQTYQEVLYGLIPRIESETGVKVRKEIAQEKIDAYTSIGGAPHLDDGYTVFGEVISGLEVIDKIASVDKDGADRPLQDIHFTIEVEEVSKKKIAKEYGYTFPEVQK